jgi:hypothetical protein
MSFNVPPPSIVIDLCSPSPVSQSTGLLCPDTHGFKRKIGLKGCVSFPRSFHLTALHCVSTYLTPLVQGECWRGAVQTSEDPGARLQTHAGRKGNDPERDGGVRSMPMVQSYGQRFF